MDTPKDNPDVVVNPKARFAQVQVPPLQQAIERVRQAYSKEPLAPVIPIETSPIYKPLLEETAIDPVPVPVDAEGIVVDMAKYRRVEAARQEVDDAYAAIAEEIPPNDTA